MDENDITKKSNDITSSSSVLSKLFKALDENGRYLQVSILLLPKT